MTRTLLIRGMLVGILAGLLAFTFAKVYGEPQVDLAIAFEEHMDEMKGMAAEPELVSRPMQASFGLFTGVMAYSCALGGIFSLAFAYAHGRLGRFSPRGTAAILAAAAFIVVILIPQLKYPANPPSIGNPDTIGERTGLYFTMIALSVIAALAALGTGRRLVAGYGQWNATLIAGAAYLIVMAIAMYVLPVINEVPQDFSAVVLWKFRLAALGIQTTLWTTLGVAFGIAAEKALGYVALKGRLSRAF